MMIRVEHFHSNKRPTPSRFSIKTITTLIITLSVFLIGYGISGKQRDKQPGKNKNLGKILYQSMCQSCHSVNNQKMTGPTFRRLWGRRRRFVNSRSRIADARYISDSIKNPGRDIVRGYTNAMPVFPLKPAEIDAITTYIRSLRH